MSATPLAVSGVPRASAPSPVPRPAGGEAREAGGVTVRAVVVSIGVAAAVSAALPYVILTVGFAPNVSLLATFLGFLMLSASRALRGRPGSRFELHAAHVAGVAAGQSAFACVALAALDILRGAGAIEAAPPGAAVLAAWLASAGCLGVLLASFARRHFIDDEALPFAGGAVAAEAILVLDAGDGAPRRRAHAPLLVALAGSAASAALGVPRGAFAAVGSAMLLGPRVAAAIGLGSTIAAALRLGAARGLGGSAAIAGALDAVRAGGGAAVARAAPAAGLAGAMGGASAIVRAIPWCAMAMLVAAACASIAASLWGARATWRRLIAGDSGARPIAPSARDGARGLGGVVFAARRGASPGRVAVAVALAAVCAIGTRVIGVPMELTLASVALSLPLLLVGTRVLGETNWAPSGALTAVAQAALAALVPGCLVGNMLGSAVAGAIPAGGAHMMQSLRAAKIVGATPRDTLVFQLLGALVGALGVGAVYPRLVARYGLGPGGLVSPLSVSAASIGELFARGAGALPEEAVVAVAAGALAGIALAAAGRGRALVPAPVPLAIGLLLPLTTGAAMAAGGAIGWAWRRSSPETEAAQKGSVAAGAIAGDALAAVSDAFLG